MRLQLRSFPRSAWECPSRRSASIVFLLRLPYDQPPHTEHSSIASQVFNSGSDESRRRIIRERSLDNTTQLDSDATDGLRDIDGIDFDSWASVIARIQTVAGDASTEVSKPWVDQDHARARVFPSVCVRLVHVGL
jgi:hypothetical protein